MRQIKLLGLVIVLLSFFACGQPTENNQKSKFQEGWSLLNEKDYSIQYPDNWNLNTSGMMESSFVLFSKTSSSTDLFRENVNLLIQNLAGQQIDLDEYVEISESQVKAMVTNGNLIESVRLIKDGMEYHKMIYTGDQGQYNLKFEQFLWITNDQAYVLTLTCEKTEFDNYQEIGEAILNSFKIN